MRDVQESRFTTHDGVKLFYYHWPISRPVPDGTRQAVLPFHRGHGHSGRVIHPADELDLPKHDFFAWDARGRGLSSGIRGDSPSFATSVCDVQTFVDHIQVVHGITEERMAMVAQSVGAMLAATQAHNYAPKVRALALASPAFQVKLYMPFARSGLKLIRLWYGNFSVNSYVRARFLDHDLRRVASYDNDPLIAKVISVNVLFGLYEAAERVVADARAIRISTQLLISGANSIIHRASQERFSERLGSLHKEKYILPGFFRDTLGERDRHLTVGHARRFFLGVFATVPGRPNLLDASRLGHTCVKAEVPIAPLSKNLPRDLCRRITHTDLYLGSPWSDGVKLNFDTGFDSGSTLDYIYRDQPSSSNPLGRLVDCNHLDSIGWRGTRQRKLHTGGLLHLAIQRLHEEQCEMHVVDIVVGHGRYILKALQGVEPLPESILLYDYSEINVRDGSVLIESKDLASIAHLIKGDTFDRADLAALQPKPSLGVVSGFYELFTDNRMINDSLAGPGEALEEGDYLVYTEQPWHPQLELITRALTSHCQGQVWTIRRRTQAGMDQLVAAAGFCKITRQVDQWDIFNVPPAQKVTR